MNKIHRIVWSAVRGAFVVAQETAASHGKPSSVSRAGRAAVLLASLLGIAVSPAPTFAAPPVNALPTGGQIVGGAAAGTISTAGSAMTIQQNQQRMIANWDTFNIGQSASVHFQQPGGGVALNRVNGGQPSEIFGKLSATGAVYLLNSAGIIFGRSAQVDVGALVASTGKLSDADFLAGKLRILQQGSGGKILNEGQLKAAVDGYIALLAPEVRNQGVIFAEKGTVALAAGEAYELQFEGTRLANVRVQPGEFAALVENGNAVEAPGGLIILSAHAVSRLQGAAIKNNGILDASSLTMKGGRIVLEASDRIENTGSIKATGSINHPGGSVEITAPVVEHSGSIDVSGSGVGNSGGNVLIQAAERLLVSGEILARGLSARGGEVLLKLSQTLNLQSGSRIDVSGATEGGRIEAEAGLSLKLAGELNASGQQAGGEITLAAGQAVNIDNATVDASGGSAGGRIRIQAEPGVNPGLLDPANPLNDPTTPGTPTQVAITGSTSLSARSRAGKGGQIDITGDDLLLGSGTQLDASGETGGGLVRVGGGWQGSGGLYQATTVTMEQGALIDVSATKVGAGGTAVLWSDIHKDGGHTHVAGTLLAEGGGQVETSGHKLTIADSASVKTAGGLWLLDPYDFTIGTDITGANLQTALGQGNVSITTLAGSASCTGATCGAGNSSGNGDIIFNDAVSWSTNTLTLSAYRHIAVNSVLSVSGNAGLTVTTNTSSATDSTTSSIGYLKMKQNRSGNTGTDTFDGKINWTSSGALSINGSTYTKVSTQAELEAISDSTKYFLANDIALTGTWTPLTLATPFSGTLEGLGHTLTGLNTAKALNQYVGLFAKTNNVTLQNLGLINSNITGYQYVGGLIGEASGSTTLRGVFTSANSTVGYYNDGTRNQPSFNLGGLVGLTLSATTVTIADSYNAAAVKVLADSTSGGGSSLTIAQAGGILGSSSTGAYKINNVANYASIIGGTEANQNSSADLGNSVGGLFGYIIGGHNAGTSYILGSRNYGAIYGNQNIGGIIGQGGIPSENTNLTLQDIRNEGSITGQSSVGGIAGQLYWNAISTTIMTMTRVGNSGTITGNSAGSEVGGIVGYLQNLAGNSNRQLIGQSLLNSGSVTGGNYVGGLFGRAQGYYNCCDGSGTGYHATIKLNDALNTGAVSALSATGYAGGVIGYAEYLSDSSHWFQVINLGQITSAGSSAYVGNMAGWVQSVMITQAGSNHIGNFGLSGAVANNNMYGKFNNTPNVTVPGDNDPTKYALKISTELQGTLASLNLSSTYWGGGNGSYPYLLGFTVPVTINITSGLSSIYGSPPSGAETGFTLSGCSGCITLNYGGFITATTNAGSYSYASNPTLLSITYTSGTASDYAISWGTNNSFTVNPRPINITVNSGQTKTYGAANPTYTYTAETAGSGRGLVNSDTFSGALARVAGENVGTYAINSVGTLANSNYTITVVPANFSITPASLTIAATNQSKTYGDTLALGTTAFTPTGLQNGETIGGVTLTASGGTAATANAGSYTITPSATTGGTFTASNYTITYTPNSGTLTVNPAAITLTASNQSKTYGSTLTLGTTAYTITSGALKNSDTISGVTLSSAGAVDSAAVTTYNITPSAATGTGGFNTTNYTISYGTGTLTVNKATLTVTAANDSKTYNAVAYSGGNGATFSGFVLGQDATALGSDFVGYGGTAQGATNAGSYTITLLGYTSSNYSFTYVPGTLTINKAALTITGAAINNKPYDGLNTASFSNYGSLSGTVYGSDAPAINTGSTTATFDSLNAATGIGVTASYAVNGAGASNYQITTPAGLTADITPRTVTLTTTKTYDGSSSLTGAVTIGNLVGGQALTYTGATANDAHVATAGKYVSAITLADGAGGLASNYQLPSLTAAGGSNGVTINARTVTLSGSKTYDGTTSLTGAITLGNMVSGENLTYTGATANDAHVATANKFVSAITLANGSGGVASDYVLPTLNNANTPVSISAATLTPTLTNAGVTKAYDGDANSGFTPTWSFSGLASGDSAAMLNNTGRTYNSKDVVDANTITVAGLSISGITGGNSSAASDYVLDATSKTVAGTISAKTLTVSGLAASNKTYNASTDVTISNWGSVTTGVGSETLVLNHGTASFSDKNKADGKTVTAINYSLANGSNGGLSSNYQLSSTSATTTANITAKTITLAGSTGVTKTYDGRTSMTQGTNGYGSLVGVESGDTVTISGAPVFSDANQGVRTINVGTVGIAGTDAGNYSLSWSNGSGTITPATLTITANADAKFVTQADAATYNGVSYSGFVNGETTAVLGLGSLAYARTNAGVNGAGTYSGVIQPSGVTANNGNYSISYVNGSYTIVPADQLLVTVSNAAFTYGDAPSYSIVSAKYLDGSNNIQTLAAPTVSGNTFTYSDGVGGTAVFTLGPVSAQTSTNGALKAGNYSIGASNITETSANFSNTLTVVGALTVNQKAVTASATGISKTYDGTTAMTNVSLGLAGLLANDVVNVTGNGNFSTKDAGTGKAFTVSSVTLSSTDAANYYLTGGNSFLGADGEILKKTVSLSATKVYDGTTDLAGFVSIATGVGSETLSYTGATANSKNVGNGNFISAITLQNGSNGGLAGNYQLPTLNNANAPTTITQKALTVSGITAANKVYDGNDAAAVSTADALYAGLVSGDVFSVSATGVFNDKNVGTGKTVTLTSSYAGADVANYSITGQASISADVTQKALTVSGITAANKIYDGNDAATVSTAGALYAGLVSGDTFSVSATGVFSDKNVGAGKTVTLTSSYAGADVANYSITGQASTSANVMQKALTVSGITAADKVYDGNAVASVSTAGVQYAGLVTGDTFSVSATGLFNNKNVGAGKTVTLTSTYSGADVGNYSITDQASTSADVMQKALTMTGHSAKDKTFDGLTSAETMLGTLNGLVGSETLTVSDTGTFVDPNVGVGKTVTIQLALADGINGGLASNYSVSNPTTTATINPQPTTVPPPPPSVPTVPTPPAEVPTPPPPPAPPGDPISTPAPSSDPTGTPVTSRDPTGTPAPSSDPTGTPAPSSDPTGTPVPSRDPTGTPAPSSDPTGTPAPSSDPTGTPAPSRDPIPVTLATGAEIPLGGSPGAQGAPSSSSSSVGGGGDGNGNGNGNGFVSVRSFGATTVPKDSLFSFTLPKDTFKHADPKAAVVLEARLIDGKPLPDWLQFNPGTGRFTGKAPQGMQQIEISVTARDNSGGEATTKVVLSFSGASEVN